MKGPEISETWVEGRTGQCGAHHLGREGSGVCVGQGMGVGVGGGEMLMGKEKTVLTVATESHGGVLIHPDEERLPECSESHCKSF